jgi:hypothetical protein
MVISGRYKLSQAMKKEFEFIFNTRNNFIRLVSEMSVEQLNTIPHPFRNNIIWNLGHIIASQQILCYHLSKLPFTLDMELINQYKKGTVPPDFVDENSVQFLVKAATETIERMQSDYEKGIFIQFEPYTTAFGAKLETIEDGIKYMSIHDGIHFGYAMALRKLVL